MLQENKNQEQGSVWKSELKMSSIRRFDIGFLDEKLFHELFKV